LLGVDPAPGLDGVDVSDLFGEAKDDLSERPLFAEADSGRERDANHAVRRGRFVLHLHTPSGHHRLYDLASDPGERIDVSAEHPEIVRELRASLAERPADIEATPTDPLTPDEATRLRELEHLN
jgi:arylsulfatase A-like enzyme